MEFYDTHAHFGDADDVEAIYARAAAAGVTRILAVGGGEELNRNALRTAGRVALGWDRDQLDRVAEQMVVLPGRSGEHTSELQSLPAPDLVCRLLLEIEKASCRERV